jgi:hypothetical protein
MPLSRKRDTGAYVGSFIQKEHKIRRESQGTDSLLRVQTEPFDLEVERFLADPQSQRGPGPVETILFEDPLDMITFEFLQSGARGGCGGGRW